MPALVNRPAMTDYLDSVTLEWDGEDYILCFQFPGELHTIKVLQLPRTPTNRVAMMTAAKVLADLCPLPQVWKQPANKLAIIEYWAKSDMLQVSDISPDEKEQ